MENSQQFNARKSLAQQLNLTGCKLILLAVTLNKKDLDVKDMNYISSLTSLLKSTEKIYDSISAEAVTHCSQMEIDDNLNQMTLSQINTYQEDVITKMLEVFNKISEENINKFGKETEPLYFEIKCPDPLFTGRSKELLELHQNIHRRQFPHKGISKITIVSGLGGMGKTELTRKYISTYSQQFAHIIWINAENDETIQENFLRLAKDRLGIKTRDSNGGHKHISTLIIEVYNSLFGSPNTSLIVFDNAQNKEYLQKYLPLCLPLPPDNHPFVLITSRENHWPPWTRVINLEEMGLDDSIHFVQRALSINSTEVIETTKLVQTLQCFPLALQQATSHILKMKDRNPSYTIDSYLKAYDTNKKKLLNSSTSSNLLNDYKLTTFSTWTTTIKAITADEEYGALSIKMLNCVAYFEPEKISTRLFIKLTNHESFDDLSEALQLLSKYSMIKEDQQNGEDKFSVHRLVQEVIRTQLKDAIAEEQVLNTCLDLLGLEIYDDVVDHAISVWKYAVGYTNLVKMYKYLPYRLINCLIKQGRYNESLDFAVGAHQLLENILGEDDKNVLEIKEIIEQMHIRKNH